MKRAIIVEFPEHADLFSSVQVQVGKKTVRTHNSLLVSFPGADGMKTGFICESGFNVVASATVTAARSSQSFSASHQSHRAMTAPPTSSRRASAATSGNRCSARGSMDSRSKPR